MDMFTYQVSNGGAAFFAGKSINNKEPPQQASIAGSVAMALHVRQMAKFYGIPVVLHSDHCAKKLLPWFDGMLEADEVEVRHARVNHIIVSVPSTQEPERTLIDAMGFDHLAASAGGLQNLDE